jgi:hypothetical protein
MAFREVTMLEVKEVLRLWLGGAPKKRISAQLGLNVKTARRYIGAARAEGLARETGPEALDANGGAAARRSRCGISSGARTALLDRNAQEDGRLRSRGREGGAPRDGVGSCHRVM